MANERILSETGGIKVVIYRTPNQAARLAALNFCGIDPEGAGLILTLKSGLPTPLARALNRAEAAVVAFVDDGDGKEIAIDAWIGPTRAANRAEEWSVHNGVTDVMSVWSNAATFAGAVETAAAKVRGAAEALLCAEARKRAEVAEAREREERRSSEIADFFADLDNME